MEEQKKFYCITELEVVLKGANFVFGFINISHIPYNKLEELFMAQVKHERFLFDDGMGYWIDEKLYQQHKVFLDEEIPFTFDFKLFDYSVHLSSVDVDKYKKNYYEELPPSFNK